MVAVCGLLAIGFGIFSILNRDYVVESMKASAPKSMAYLVSDEKLRAAPLWGGIAFITFGVVVAAIGIFLLVNAASSTPGQ